MEATVENTQVKSGFWIKNAIIIKIISIGILIIFLMIPAVRVENLIYERQSYEISAINEVSSKWGGSQTLTGPVLTIPYKTYTKTSEGTVHEYTHFAHFLPDKLNYTGKVAPEVRKRGIYEVPLYNAKVKCTGSFGPPDFSDFKIPDQDIRWSEAFITVGISDTRGIKDNVVLTANDKKYGFEPGTNRSIAESGVTVKIPMVRDSASNFSFDLDINGSGHLYFTPSGQETTVELESAWQHPSFDGHFLPDTSNISEAGFTAKWSVFDFNRNFPQKWLDKEYDMKDSHFGVKLFMPVDHYQINLRAVKYALLVICLTFLVYFFFEILNKRKIHPLQYTLVGLALSIFYLLLLSITEHLGFDLAYGLASVLTVSLITGYSGAIIKHRNATLILLALMVIIYGFIYVILQMESYALLTGSLGLFIALTLVMVLSRKIDWYAFRQ